MVMIMFMQLRLEKTQFRVKVCLRKWELRLHSPNEKLKLFHLLHEKKATPSKTLPCETTLNHHHLSTFPALQDKTRVETVKKRRQEKL